ncbi:MAG TPA: DegT/DnrJ/EryC1/StrS family aminotransferase [Phycisphaerae bacterium]|nr:DegT/DnrJ/EryC1/StrS family aminotransferase [Phycisphaerae bacterium]HOJ74393.1 DegT/DnrJ/EryC1/StrS family aminotransferase [Phycisphaerae bacterium]HOM52882.1 DegT/DnrJ/EryC1/StrS family aminotransferase [Phycisphaerae bacterium]HOQ86889.1 DegT/DnrJ/EryC1/StrS family aminotransferase [Phycisphaerae bacterium]HPP27134.1 DegT/DnrJ/EryC1/StrS family aminotransferase [Phycisphaerae bacterium]
MQIPLSRPDISQAEREAVQAVLMTPNLSLGPKVPEFEQAFRDYLGVKYAVAVNSGTSAMHLVMRAMGIGRGDEVIVPSFTFIASANCIMFDGGRPVFVDVDPDTWNIDPAKIEAAITPRTKALLPVDVFGQPADMDPIRRIADKHGLRVFEDSCEALGATYKGRKAGTLGDAGVFGFYPNKQITTGEGGMIVTNDEAIYKLASSMRNQGREGMGWLGHARLGYNYRLSDINCALGIAQMGRLEEILANRRNVAEMYVARLKGHPRFRLQKILPDCRISWFVMVIRLNDDYTPAQRDQIIENLRKQGIGASNYFPPVHLQPFYVEELGCKRGMLPVCEALSDRTIALPFHGHLTESEVDRVCEALFSLL